MKKLLLFIALLNGLSLFSSDLRDGLINSKSAIFYAPNFDSIGNLPSMALTNEFNKTGSLPGEWGIQPTFYTKAGKSIVTLPITNGASLYGTGEVTGPLLRNGKTINLWNSDNWGYQKYNGTQLYQSHPWVLAVNSDGSAYGILADNTWKQQLILSDSIRFISDGPAFRVIVIKGNSPQEVITSLTDLIGRIELPPLWAIGYQQSRWSYQPASRVKEIANTFISKKIPCDVIWMDIDYMDAFKIFTFDTAKFPDPAGLNTYLHSKGFKAVWMIDPGVKVQTGYSVYDSGTKNNHWVQKKTGGAYTGDVWPGQCVFPDFTRPETRTWWAGLYPDFMAKGIDGVWNDMNEPAIFNVDSGTMPTDNIHRGGGDLPQGSHLRYHNVYGSLMIRSTREGIKATRPDKRPFVLSRSGFLGSHRYGATWTGDNAATTDQMKLSVPMILNLGLSGQPFSGADIGGYSGTTSASLFGQWLALGVFYPFARGHAESGTNDKEPWAFGPEIEDASRTAIKRRYRLMPYLYTLFHEASTKGLPVLRPVFFADPSDLSLRKEEKAFLMGSDLLVIPKWATTVAMPKGVWRSISLVGENSKNDIYQPDVKLRDGAIIPLGKDIQNTTEFSHDSLTLVVSLNGAGLASGSVYEDAGEGYDYQSGGYLLSTFSAEKQDSIVTVKIRKQSGNFLVSNRKYLVKISSNNKVFTSNWTADSTILVRVDPMMMDITITSPGANSSIKSDILITSRVNIEKGKVDSVAYYDNGTTFIGKSTSVPYQFNWVSPSAGIHKITAIAYSQGKYSLGSDTVKVLVQGLMGTGEILRQVWNGVAGETVSTLTSNTNYPFNPDVTTFENSFNAPGNFGDNYGQRMVGYLTPPVSGNYTFGISSDDYSQLWLSTTDNVTNRVLIASVEGWSDPNVYDKSPSQKSKPFYLQAGGKYYIEAIHKEAFGGDHLTVVWQIPGWGGTEVIPGNYLSPLELNTNGLTVVKNEGKLILYPNPASKCITIQKDIQIKRVRIVNLSGVTILELNNYNKNTIDISNLHSGIYTIEITDADNKLLVSKFKKS